MKLVMWIIFEIDFDDVIFLRMFINKVCDIGIIN